VLEDLLLREVLVQVRDERPDDLVVFIPGQVRLPVLGGEDLQPGEVLLVGDLVEADPHLPIQRRLARLLADAHEAGGAMDGVGPRRDAGEPLVTPDLETKERLLGDGEGDAGVVQLLVGGPELGCTDGCGVQAAVPALIEWDRLIQGFADHPLSDLLVGEAQGVLHAVRLRYEGVELVEDVTLEVLERGHLQLSEGLGHPALDDAPGLGL